MLKLDFGKQFRLYRKEIFESGAVFNGLQW